jgi:hypothetical protein
MASKELLDLVTETKKQLEHLRVLGVEGIRASSAVAPAPVITAQKPKPAPAPPPAPAPVRVEKTMVEPLNSLFGNLTPAPVKLERSNRFTLKSETARAAHFTRNERTSSTLKATEKRV